MERKKITQKEWNELHKHWKTIVNCVFRAEDALGDEPKQKLRDAKGKTPDEIKQACDEYVGTVVDEILGYTFEVK